MREMDNILSVAALRPDHIGFIEYPSSPRFVGSEFISPELPSMISRVGVFVNETIEVIRKRSSVSGYDTVQLHGGESPDFADRLRDAGLKVIKVFRVDDAFDFSETRPYIGKIDQLLFDARGRQPGGNGIKFNPLILERYDQQIPFFLSGGLQPETLVDDIHGLTKMNLYGVDLNSGVEIAPGLKDVSKVEASIRSVKGFSGII